MENTQNIQNTQIGKTAQDFLKNIQHKTQLEKFQIEELQKQSKVVSWETSWALLNIILIVSMIVLIVLFTIMQHVKLRHQYGDMIKWVDSQIQQNYYSGKGGDGYQIAWWTQYPHLAFSLQNQNFPFAVVYTFYSPTMGPAFQQDPTSIETMYLTSITGPALTAVQIACAWWQGQKGEQGGAKVCQQGCPMPPVQTGAEVVTSISTMTMMGAAIGSFVPGFGTAVGAGLGLATGLVLTGVQGDQMNKACDQQQQNCISSSTYTCGQIVW